MNMVQCRTLGHRAPERHDVMRNGWLKERLFNKIRQCNRRMIHHGERERSP
jgi:hypothetical protein